MHCQNSPCIDETYRAQQTSPCTWPTPVLPERPCTRVASRWESVWIFVVRSQTASGSTTTTSMRPVGRTAQAASVESRSTTRTSATTRKFHVLKVAIFSLLRNYSLGA